MFLFIAEKKFHCIAFLMYSDLDEMHCSILKWGDWL